MFTVQVDTREVTARYVRLTEDVRGRIRAVIIKDNPILAGKVRANLSGRVLNVRSGKLLNSIRNEMVENATSIYGRVYSQGVPYAGIHERGGVTRPHVIVPVRAKALRFEVGGKVVFAQRVNHPGSKIPARPYLAPALAEMTPQILRDLADAVRW